MLEVDENAVTAALSRALGDDELERDGVTGEPLIYLPGLLHAETCVARKILDLADGPAPYPEIDLPAAIGWYEHKTGRALSPSQRAALAEAFSARVFIITGGPGVGKTT